MELDYWGLATLQPFGAEAALENLSRQDHDHYFPRFLEIKIRKGRKIEEPAPLFPGYLFVFISERWSSIKHTKGIGSVVMCGSKPSRMLKSEIDRIKANEADGFVIIPERSSKFVKGQSVRVVGLMENSVGIYQGDTRADRTKVLFQMLGRSVPVFVRESDLVAVA